MYCYKHAQKYASKENITTLAVHRSVFIDREATNTTTNSGEADNAAAIIRTFKKKQHGNAKNRLADFRDVKFALGDLVVSDFGVLVPASDRPEVSFLLLLAGAWLYK